MSERNGPVDCQRMDGVFDGLWDIATQEVDLHIDESNLASRKCFESLGAKYISNANSRYYRLTIPIEKLSSN